jgi:Domain of unknown function (DUF1918)
MHAKIGDEIVVDSVQVGGPARKGEILEVQGEEGHEHYVVRWDDGHESLFYPGSTTHVVNLQTHRRT